MMFIYKCFVLKYPVFVFYFSNSVIFNIIYFRIIHCSVELV